MRAVAIRKNNFRSGDSLFSSGFVSTLAVDVDATAGAGADGGVSGFDALLVLALSAAAASEAASRRDWATAAACSRSCRSLTSASSPDGSSNSSLIVFCQQAAAHGKHADKYG